mgnify:FL=1
MSASGHRRCRDLGKCFRYCDKPGTWTTPGTMDDKTYVPGPITTPGPRVATATVKTMNPAGGQIRSESDQYEMYNVTADPDEPTNLAGNSAYAVQQVLAKTLEVERSAKRLPAQTGGLENRFVPAVSLRGRRVDGPEGLLS